jgi:4a-hydroxytetrahydrobiopterin dehydratase
MGQVSAGYAAAMDVLSSEQIGTALQGLDSWGVREGALHRRYTFDDFAGAMAFANRVAAAAEEAGHHPDILVTWGACELTWVSHSAGGITENDVAMARLSDQLSERR